MSERGLHHPAVHDLLLQAAPPAPRTWTWSSEFAQDLTAEVLATGDIARGQEIFRRAELTCVACHAIAGDGGKIGPALDAVGTAQPVDFLIGAVLAPQKELKEGYEAVQATTKTGDVVIGYRAPGAPQDLNLRQPASGEINHIPRSNLETEKSLGSLMPANLVNSLTREELRDLIRYLASLGKTAP
jgi:putative heme-binding domain-containing protein